MKKIILFTAIMLFASYSGLNAQIKTGTNTARQGAQQARIGQGVNTNELTRRETARLEREQRRIQIEKRIANADGTVTPAEKKFLRKEQNRASRNIARQKNDSQERKIK